MSSTCEPGLFVPGMVSTRFLPLTPVVNGSSSRLAPVNFQAWACWRTKSKPLALAAPENMVEVNRVSIW